MNTPDTPENAAAIAAEEARINAGIGIDPDNPAWSAADFQAAQPAATFFDGATLTQLVTLKRPRGRPPVEQAKILIPLRLDADVVAAFRHTGKGWQTRMNAVLRSHILEQSGPEDGAPETP
jgi:uncharacterized protein (DUF4415 family)